MKWPPDDYDEYMRGWRRKFRLSVLVGVVVGLVLTGFLLYANR